MTKKDDSISRKEVLQMIDNIRDAGGFIGVNTYHEAFNQVNNMPSVPRWTPVSEGFPTKKDGYFVSVKKGYVTTALWCGTAEYWHDVIAWMPFPKPYKTEREEAENMTYCEPIYNLKQAKSVPYRKAIFSKVNELPNELEQESMLDKIKAEIEEYKSTIDKAISEDELKIEGMKEAYVRMKMATSYYYMAKIIEVIEDGNND